MALLHQTERERELLPPGSTKGNMFEAARDKPQRAAAVNELTQRKLTDI